LPPRPRRAPGRSGPSNAAGPTTATAGAQVTVCAALCALAAATGVVRVLASEHGDALEPVLRSFELLLLREIGLLPGLDVQTMTFAPLQPDTRYTLVPEGGLRAASAADRAGLPGRQWQALQRGLDDAASYTATLRACAPVAAELKPQLRALLQYHCGSPTLRTRQLMIDLQSL